MRIIAHTVEIFLRGQRVGTHQRRYIGRKHGTDPDHMSSSHRRYAEWTPDRFRHWAGKIGPSTEGLIIAVLASRPHPEQGFLTCLGILRSYRGVDPAHVEAAHRLYPGLAGKGVRARFVFAADPALVSEMLDRSQHAIICDFALVGFGARRDSGDLNVADDGDVTLELLEDIALGHSDMIDVERELDVRGTELGDDVGRLPRPRIEITRLIARIDWLQQKRDAMRRAR